MADTNNQNSFLDYAGLALFWNNIKKIIEDNELVTTTALTDLDTRLDDIEDLLSQTSPIIEKTYAELKTLRDNSQLVPGMQYEIIDYYTTAISVDKSVLSTACDVIVEEHPFNIIVTALSSNKLDETVKVGKNINSTYFDTTPLESWEIKYCLDNDINRFMWADTTNGRGVIYYMKDEFGNECPYDFKNIKFKYNDNYYYTFHDVATGKDASMINMYCYSNIIAANNPWGKYNLNGIIFLVGENSYCYGNVFGPNCINITINSGGEGSFNNHFGHTCKNIVLGSNNYKNTFSDGCKEITFGENCYKNILDLNSTNIIFGQKCNDNTINSNSNNISVADYCVGNIIGMRNSNITFSENCNVNILGSYSKNIIFGENCEANTLAGGENDNYSQYLKFDTDSKYNSIGLGFNHNITDIVYSNISGCSNTIGNMCNSITISGDYNNIADKNDNITLIGKDNTLTNDGCYNINIFGQRNIIRGFCGDINMQQSDYNEINNSFRLSISLDCNRNIFEHCYTITLGSDCYDNVFGTNCSDIIFESGCSRNSIGVCSSNISLASNTNDSVILNECNNIVIGSNCKRNFIGPNNTYITIGDSSKTNSFGTGCSYITLDTACNFNSFGNGNSNIITGSNCSSNSFGNTCKNISFRKTPDYDSEGNHTGQIKGYCSFNSFDNGCSNIILYSPKTSNKVYNYKFNAGVKGDTLNPLVVDAQYLESENVCNVYKKGNVAVVAHIQY